MKPRPRHYIEYAVMRTLGAVVRALPYRAALALAWVAAAAACVFARRTIRTAEARASASLGPELDRREIRRIVRTAWRNLAFGSIDLLKAARGDRNWFERTTDWREAEKFFQMRAAGQRVIVAVPHMGSWEAAGLGLALLGVEMLTIVRAQRNPLTTRYLNEVRSRTGQACIDRDEPLLARKALRAIRQGQLLVLLPDVRARQDAVHVRFLGGEANVPAGMASLARAARAVILPACVLREGWVRHKWVVFDPVTPDMNAPKKQDIERMTRQVLGVFDQAVRRRPDLYFWFNKRWVLDPIRPGGSAGTERSTFNV